MRQADLEHYAFALPSQQIATQPTIPRDESRLLVCQKNELLDSQMKYLAQYLPANSLILFNNSKVLPARILLTLVSHAADRRLSPSDSSVTQQAQEKKIEFFILTTQGQQAKCMTKNMRRLKPGDQFVSPHFAAPIELIEKEADSCWLQFPPPTSAELYCEKYGLAPLPPYILKQKDQRDDEKDKEYYQTVFAQTAGSLAAPTAGLHFQTENLNQLKAQGHHISFVTLHIGRGTFANVTAEHFATNRLFEESYHIPQETCERFAEAKQKGQPIIAVGTTTLRTLESAVQKNGSKLQSGSGTTSLFITPGYKFSTADYLLTNFHLPKSSLMVLVHAFGGDRIFYAYRHAVNKNYKFYSFGDAMLIDRPSVDPQ